MVQNQFEVNIGGDLMVTLVLDALPLPGADNFTWTFNGVTLMPSGRISFTVDTIQFTGVDLSDGGVYMVTATNEAGSGSASFLLVINGRLIIIGYNFEV